MWTLSGIEKNKDEIWYRIFKRDGGRKRNIREGERGPFLFQMCLGNARTQ